LPFATAVQRLRKRQCTDEDIKLFNSRVMKSEAYPDGICLGPDDERYYSASLIVRTNREREALNDAKSNVECIERVVCAARDHIDGKEIDDMRVRKFLLSLDVSPFTSSGALLTWVYFSVSRNARYSQAPQSMSTTWYCKWLTRFSCRFCD
jgi:hypothetical protein